MSPAESGAVPASELSQLHDLYARHLYLDAYSLTAGLWKPSTNIQRLSLDELVFGGRLAARLGGMRLSRWLLREALQRDPTKPLVRFFCRHVRSPKLRLLDDLKAFNAEPDLGGDDPEIRAGWYASYAFTWATLRDFERARECLRAAHGLFPDDSWILSCESTVLGMEDRWTDALVSAERAWELDPGAPYAATSLGTSLLHLGRVEESADRLEAASEKSQSFQIVVEASWYQCALAETLEGAQRGQRLERARALADKLSGLAPLADRETEMAFARVRLDAAELADDRPEIERWSSELRVPFHRQRLRNLQKNSQGRRIRLAFRPIIQKHQTCLPASVAVALSASGGIVSAEEMAAAVTFGGTYEWAAADWLRARGFHVRFFPVTAELAKNLIEHQIAFVISWEADAAGHAVAVVGFDERAESLMVHDPGFFRRTEYLVAVLDRNASPLGIKGMVVVPKERASELDALLPRESAVMEAAQEHQKAITLGGPTSARQIVDQIEKSFPSHPGTLHLRSHQQLDDGHIGQALQGFRELLARFPNSPQVRIGYLSACRALGNSALIGETLKGIVERRALPGLEAQQDWIHPPERYVCEYADLLRLSTETRGQAESMLYSLLQRQSGSAGAWHNLGDLLTQKRDLRGALLCYRLASSLAETDEHYARAYADSLADDKRVEEGFRWLEERVQRFGMSTHAVATWISLIAALEDRGYPERAIAACKDAVARHQGSPELHLFAVPFFARMGDWDRAEACLSQLAAGTKPAAFHQASVDFFRMRGDLKKAKENATAWIRERPLDMQARRAMLELIAAADGSRAALETAADWMRENRNHEEFEQAYCAQIDNLGSMKWKKQLVLRKRLRRNPEDAWAWREITFAALYQYDGADPNQKKRLERRIPNLLAECDRTSRDDVRTIRAHALWSELSGDWPVATAKWLETIKLEPLGFYSYREVWECSARLSPSERQHLWDQIEPVLLNSSGHLPIAREVMGLLAERFGFSQAQKVVESWMKTRPGDPNVVQAAADLLIDDGHGRSDAFQAAEMLKTAVERYPYHSGLRISLANAYRRAGRDSVAEEVLSEIVRRHPDNSAAMIQLAWIRHRNGDQAQALKVLDDASSVDPRNPGILDVRVQILLEGRRFEDACRAIECGLEQMPDNVYWRNRAISLFSQCGLEAKAIQTARAGVEVYPRGAYLWLLLGRALNDMRHFAGVGEIEVCLRRSLRLNAALFEAADLLSILLTEQKRYAEAAQVMREFEVRMSDPTPALGRLAWIKRVQGQKQEARRDISNAIIQTPWYAWGWSVLIGWLEEDKDWEQALQLLREIPPQMFTNTSFRLARLQLLEKAGLQPAQLDAEWDALLRDFPENVSLFVTRYDSLQENKRADAARSVLASILEIEPENPYILARRVEVLALAGDENAALEVALRVCFRTLEESPWTIDKVWDVALTRGFADRLYQKAFERLANGEKPTVRSFARMAAYVMRNEKKHSVRPRTETWILFGAVKKLVRLGQLVRTPDWKDPSSYRAEIYRELCEHGYHRVVRRRWKKNGNLTMEVGEWSQIGRALVALGFQSEGRRFLGTWRQRPGVAMWMITNYTLCLSRFRNQQLKELRGTCQDALSGLPHDHCANYLAHVLAESCALLGDKEGFLKTYNHYSAYFDQPLKDGEYFQPKRRHLLRDIPIMARSVRQNETWQYRKTLWKLRWHSLPSTKIAGSPRSLAGIPWWGWWIIFMVALQLFRSSQY